MSFIIPSNKQVRCNNSATACSVQRMKAVALARKAIRENIPLHKIRTKLGQFSCFQQENQDFCQQLTGKSFELESIFLEASQREKNIFSIEG